MVVYETAVTVQSVLKVKEEQGDLHTKLWSIQKAPYIIYGVLTGPVFVE